MSATGLPLSAMTSRGWLFLLLLLLLPLRSMAGDGAFPFYHKSASLDGETTSTQVLFPFFRHEETTTGTLTALHPLFSHEVDRATGRKSVDIIWPFVRWRYRPVTYTAEDFTSLIILPLYYQGYGSRDGVAVSSRFLFPIYWQGTQGKRGQYFILFPFLWFARDARLWVPLFPTRPQSFGAVFPFFGDFRGYWNRQRIQFFLWPLYVRTRDGRGDDLNVMTSVPWPFLGIRTGPKTSGFRIWPLFSWAEKEDEYQRAYWLWPLGHYRKGRTSRGNPEQQRVVMMIPFYYDIQNPSYTFKGIFPLYGNFESRGRKTRGYFLALYNQDDNLRSGVRSHRLFWFLIRWKTRIPIAEGLEPEDQDRVLRGGGFFPFYVTATAPKRTRLTVLWPIFNKRWDRRDDHDFHRTYLVPFYSRKTKTFDDGTMNRAVFIFPFFRHQEYRRGEIKSNSLHLWWYTDSEGMDRNWSPLWTFWSRSEDTTTGAKRVKVMEGLHAFERTADGRERTAWNFLFINAEKRTGGEEVSGRKFSLFWGLYSRERSGEDVRKKLFWIPL